GTGFEDRPRRVQDRACQIVPGSPCVGNRSGLCHSRNCQADAGQGTAAGKVGRCRGWIRNSRNCGLCAAQGERKGTGCGSQGERKGLQPSIISSTFLSSMAIVISV